MFMRVVFASLVAASVAQAEAPPISRVDVKLKVASASPTAVRLWLTGGAGLPELNEFALTDDAGEAQLYTRRSTYMFVAARRRDCDLKLLGAKRTQGLGGVNQLFQRGRLDLSQLGTTAKPDPIELTLKTPGKARFAFCAEDSMVLRRSLSPGNKPQPAGKVYVTGDWNNFNPLTEDVDPENGARELFDDGAAVHPDSGDELMGDGVYSRVLDLPPGEHTYVFLVNGIANMGHSFVLDPYAEGTRTATARRKWQQTAQDPGWDGEQSFPASVITVTDH